MTGSVAHDALEELLSGKPTVTRMRARFVRVASIVVALAYATPCSAVEPATWGKSNASYVATTDDLSRLPSFFEITAGYSTGGFGLGLGARVGTTFANGLYFGGSVTYQPKESLTVSPDASSPVAREYGGSLISASAELGYDIRVPVFVIRPYLGAGLGASSSELESRLGAVVSAGLQTVYSVPETLQFFAVDVRATLTTAQGDAFDEGVGVFLAYGIRIGERGR